MKSFKNLSVPIKLFLIICAVFCIISLFFIINYAFTGSCYSSVIAILFGSLAGIIGIGIATYLICKNNF